MKKQTSGKAGAAPLDSLDSVDLRILSLLQEDARSPNAEIGRRLGLVPSAIFQRVRKLEKLGVIRSYETRVDPRAVNVGLAAFIFVVTDDRVGSHATALRLAKLSEVLELHHVAGEDCYLVKVRVADAEDLGRFLREKLGAIESVQSTRTTIVLETIKETAALPLGSISTRHRGD
jgi:Lrp/AsnC family transcriptional regulator, leucine-responsive regulatory protein